MSLVGSVTISFLRYHSVGLPLWALRRKLSSNYFVTSPIFYVNADPHIGHLHSAVLADAFHRIHCLQGVESTIFSTGTDEHGLKVQKAADNAKMTLSEFCSKISSKYKKLFDDVGVGYTHFVRTTDEKHKKVVTHFWKTLQEKGHIYKGTYEGWYSTADEAFVSSTDIVDGPEGIKLSKESGHQVEWMKEENYMFRLLAFEKDLKRWAASGSVVPKKFGDILLKLMGEGLHDLSVSRQRSRLHWGIPVPGDDTQVIYVWLDALLNYLTVLNYPDQTKHSWPADCHVIGKDILKFHGIYWPAFLMAAGLEPPRKLFCHSHWMVNDQKMSKSKGNVVDPFDVAQRVTFEGLRYFLLREAVPHSDANYTEDKIKKTVNADLADTLGNLLSRCVAPVVNPEQIFPSLTLRAFPDSSVKELDILVQSVRKLPDLVQGLFLEGSFHQGLDKIMSVLHKANAFVQTEAPWTLARIPPERERLHGVLHAAFETLRVCAVLMQPVVPRLSSRILDKLSVPPCVRTWTSVAEPFPSLCGRAHPLVGCKLGRHSPVVFSRIK